MEKETHRLKGWILSHIKENGPIPFSQFMEWCLYHPNWGYYQRGGVKIGAEGDYYSSPCVHPLFGYLISKQVCQMAEVAGGAVFETVEMGGGRGFLCKDILDWAMEHEATFYDRLIYTLIEKTPFFSEEQEERLVDHRSTHKVSWMDREQFDRGMKTFEGCFLSNELIDSFPVHRVVLDHGALKEIYVSQDRGEFMEELGNLSDPRISAYFESMGVALEEGQKAEVNLEALDWVDRVARSVKKGFVLTIDYGYPAEELYAPHRREGTLLCYHQHRTCEALYDKPGEQDITSHVNFTALIQKGEAVGLRFTGLVPQYRFLIGLGLLQEMDSIGKGLSAMEALKLRLALKHLIEPEVGMGEVFKVLIQHKGLEWPQLDGLRDLDSIPWPPLGGQNI